MAWLFCAVSFAFLLLQRKPATTRRRSGFASQGSLDGPQRQGVLVFDEQAVARDDRIGVGLLVRDLHAGQFLVFLVAGLEDDQLSFGSQSQQDSAGVDDRPESVSPSSA